MKTPDTENQKGNPKQWRGVLKFFPNGQCVWNTPCKKKLNGKNPATPESRCKLTGGEYASTTNPMRAALERSRPNNADSPSDVSTGD